MWWWVLIWVCLLMVAGVYLGARAKALWGQTKQLGSELAAAERRLDAVQGQLEQLQDGISSPEHLAVFAHPAIARTQRDRARAAGRLARQKRRAASHPGSARHVD